MISRFMSGILVLVRCVSIYGVLMILKGVFVFWLMLMLVGSSSASVG